MIVIHKEVKRKTKEGLRRNQKGGGGGDTRMGTILAHERIGVEV